MAVVAGVDVGGTAVNYTLVDGQERFLVEGLCEHPSLAKQGPGICLQQIADGLKVATDRAGVALVDVVAVGLDTPGPASAAGQMSARGSTNFVHERWAGFDIREGLAHKLGKPVSYLNDANAAALWGHYAIFGANNRETSVSIIIGTGNGGGIILDGNVVKGRMVLAESWATCWFLIKASQEPAGSIQFAIADVLGTWNRFVPSPRSREICCRIFCRDIRGTNWRNWSRTRRQSSYVDLRTRAMPSAGKFFECKRMPWDCSLTRW